MIDNVLEQRQSTHGNLIDHGRTCQALKRSLHCGANWIKLDGDQQEALEMIAHKIARILEGDPDHIDHWLDIQGYARLVERRLMGAA